MKTRTLTALATTLLMTACGPGGASGGSGAASPEASASRSVGAALDLGDAVADPTGDQALGSALSLYADLQTLTAQKQATNAGTSPYGAAFGALGAACIEQSPSGGQVTYTDCNVQGAVFNGTISQAGDVVTVDLTIAMDPSASVPAGTPAGGVVSGVDVHEHGQLTINAGSIAGTLTVEVTTAIDLGQLPGAPSGLPMPREMSLKTQLQAQFAVTLEAGCAVGGTITIQSQTTGAPGAGQSLTTTATFGPACGDVSVQ